MGGNIRDICSHFQWKTKGQCVQKLERKDTELTDWSLTSLFSTNMAISETKGQRWRAIPTKWMKASDILTSTLAAFLFSSHPKRERDREAHLNFYASAYIRARQLSYCKTKQNLTLTVWHIWRPKVNAFKSWSGKTARRNHFHLSFDCCRQSASQAINRSRRSPFGDRSGEGSINHLKQKALHMTYNYDKQLQVTILYWRHTDQQLVSGRREDERQ